MQRKFLFQTLIFSLWLPVLGFTQMDSPDLFDSAVLHEIKITVPFSPFLDTLKWLYKANRKASSAKQGKQYLKSTISIDGHIIPSVGIRFKGESSYRSAATQKKPLKIDLNEFIKKQGYQGIKKFNLHNGLGDPSLQREVLSYYLLRKMGVPAPRTAYCRLYLNNQYWGLYLLVEQIDKTFLKKHFINAKGNLYKNVHNTGMKWEGERDTTYKRRFDLKTNKKKGDWQPFVDFLKVINECPNEQFEERIGQVFNVPLFLKTIAVDVLTNNWDSYLANGRNFYLYHDPKAYQLQWIPWDYNLSFDGELHNFFKDEYEDKCYVIGRFYTLPEGNLTYSFHDYSTPNVQKSFWDFGDGYTSNEINPTHTYAKEGHYKVCQTVSAIYFGDTCAYKRCLDVITPTAIQDCDCIKNKWSPYLATDTVFQKLIAFSPRCCFLEWDERCQIEYDKIATGDIGFSREINKRERDYPLIPFYPEHPLLHRIFQIDAFKKEYLAIVNTLLTDLFNIENLEPLIDHNVQLIRASVMEDPHYLFPKDFFDKDLKQGIPASPHDPTGVDITGIKQFIRERAKTIQLELTSLKSQNK